MTLIHVLVGTESIGTGHCILVKHDSTAEDVKINTETQWKAQVLEVRALDSEHVFIRVAWLNRPEDLATGRLAYHGKHELIVTNEMDIIDAMTVNGSLNVVALDDQDDESDAIEDQYFWRQTYDLVSKKFSVSHRSWPSARVVSNMHADITQYLYRQEAGEPR